MDSEQFAKGCERLISPMTAGAIQFLQPMCELLPAPVLQRMMDRSMSTTQKMGFVVEPYALFLFFRLARPEPAAQLLPDGFRLAPARVFAEDDAQPLGAMSFFRVHTSAFWGARAEFYLLAEDERTGRLSWVIIDYLSDTISHDRAFGLRGPSAPNAVVTVTAEGCVLVDMKALSVSGTNSRSKSRAALRRALKQQAAASNGSGGRSGARRPLAPSPETPRMALSVSLQNARMRPLDERLWVEGNTSIAYGRLLSRGLADTFSLTFLPHDMARALDVPTENLRIDRLTWFSPLIEPHPARIACFPFAQHTLSDSPGAASNYASPAELAAAASATDFAALPIFQAPTARSLLAASSAATGGLAAALIASLLA